MTDQDPPGGPAERTVGGFDRPARVWVLGLFGAGGVAAGLLLPRLAGWAADLPWVPFQGPLELIGSFDRSWLTWGWPVGGLVAGLLFAGYVIADSPVLRIGPAEVEVRRRGRVERVVPRDVVDAVYRRRSHVVMENRTGRTLFDDDVEGDARSVRDAFLAAGWPWEGRLD
ncbi:YqeB family protein [Modestobacter sp. SYSU DS0290]